MGIYGQDWASYQSTTPDLTGLDFAFVKVTEGTGYINPKWKAQRDHAKAHGLVWGAYHYPHMAADPVTEADFFLSQVSWQPGDLIVLDWEGYDPANRSVPKATQRAYKEAWLRHVKQRMPHNPVGMYCNADYWRNVDATGYYADFLWIATGGLPAGQPGIQAPWLIHQYGAGSVDRDFCRLTSRDALRSWAMSFQPKTPPTPPPTPAPVQEDDMPQWTQTTAIPAGDQPVTALVPHGAAWAAYKHRNLHLGMDHIGTPKATAQVRVAVHDGTTWSSIKHVSVTAAGGTVDVDVTGAVKVSLQTAMPGVSYSIESF